MANKQNRLLTLTQMAREGGFERHQVVFAAKRLKLPPAATAGHCYLYDSAHLAAVREFIQTNSRNRLELASA